MEKVRLLRTAKELQTYTKEMKAALKTEKRPRFAFDWETNISEDRFARIGVLLSLYHPLVGSASLPLGFANPDGPQLAYADAWEIAGSLFTTTSYGRVAQNGVFDVQVCRLHGLEVAYSELDFDTLHAAWLVDPDAPHDLETLGTKYGTSHKKLWPSIKALLRHYKVKQTCDAPVVPLAEYAEGDCVATYELMKPLGAELEKVQLVGNLAEELRYRSMFDRMSWEGAPVDLKRIGKLHVQYQQRMKAVEKKIYIKAGEPFNIASTAQLRTILVEKLGIKPLGRNGRVKLTKGGKSGNRQISVDEEVIEVMATNGVPIAKDILEFRTCAKLDGTYLEPYLTLAARDGRIHANFNQCGTGTGRPSCVSGESRVLTNWGLLNIASIDVSKGKTYLALTHTGRWKPILKVFTKGYSEMFRVTLNTGAELVCTGAHRVITALGWEMISGLSVGAAVLYRPDSEGPGVGHGTDSRFAWSRIVSIESVGQRLVWDLTVEEDASYVVEGFVSHNSSAPNLQNIPRPDTDFGSDGMALRSIFVPPKGCGMVAGDYSQIELRLMAHFCEDPVMVQIFKDGGDIHSETAAACSVDRHAAKIINFGIVYGMREVALAHQLNCDPGTASTFLTRYNLRFRGVSFFRRQMVAIARRFGYVRTLAGRIRRIHGIASPLEWERRHAENQAVNTPIQGSAADLIKRAQYEFVTHVAPRLEATVALQVHDELVVCAPKKNMKRVTDQLRSCMIDVAKLNVPVLVSVASGSSWDQCK